MIRIAVPTGEDVGGYLETELLYQGIAEAAVNVFGALERGMISGMNESGANIPREFKHPMEIHGIGEFENRRLHLHVTIGSAAEPARCGHFIEGIAGELFAAYVWPWP